MSVQGQIDDINRRLNDVQAPNDLRSESVNPVGATMVGVDPASNEFVRLPIPTGGVELKEITAASYTLTQDDTNKHLIFTQSCTVTVPTGLTIDSVFEGECSNGKVTFENAVGVTINVFNEFNRTTAGSFAVFGLRLTASNVATLYGTLELA